MAISDGQHPYNFLKATCDGVQLPMLDDKAVVLA